MSFCISAPWFGVIHVCVFIGCLGSLSAMLIVVCKFAEQFSFCKCPLMFPVELIIISNYLEPQGSQPLLFTILSSRKTEPPNLVSSRMCSWAYVLTWFGELPLPCSNYVERPTPAGGNSAGSPQRNIIFRSIQVHWIERYNQKLLSLAFSVSGISSCLFSAVRNVRWLWYWLFVKVDNVPSSTTISIRLHVRGRGAAKHSVLPQICDGTVILLEHNIRCHPYYSFSDLSGVTII